MEWLECRLRLLRQAKPALVRPQGQFINRVKVPVGVCHNVVAENNCPIVKWGGEQLEAKGQSVDTLLLQHIYTLQILRCKISLISRSVSTIGLVNILLPRLLAIIIGKSSALMP